MGVLKVVLVAGKETLKGKHHVDLQWLGYL